MTPRIRYFCTLGFVCLGATSRALTYVVVEGDSLSKIAGRMIPGSVWGPGGSLVKLLAENPSIENPNRVFPGDKIVLDPPTIEMRLPASLGGAKETKACPSESNEPSLPLPQERSHAFELSPYTQFTRLDAVDSSTRGESVLVSKLNVGATFSYVQSLGETSRGYLRWKLGYLSFIEPVEISRQFSQGDQIIQSIGLGWQRRLWPGVALDVSLNYGKEVFAITSNGTRVAIDAPLVASVATKFLYEFWPTDPVVLGVQGSAEFVFPEANSSYSIGSGSRYGALLYLRPPLSAGFSPDYRFELGLSVRSQNTNYNSLSETNLSLGLRLMFSSNEKRVEP